MAQLMNMMKRMPIRMDESEKKMELMATMLQTLIKNTSRKDGKHPHNEGQKDYGKKK